MCPSGRLPGLTESFVAKKMDEREFAIVDAIDRDLNLTQRELSQEVGLSLGMTNIVLKRLVKKGYVKIRGLNRKKVQYILTPQGLIEKTKKSYRYLLKTINQFSLAKQKIQELVLNQYRKGKKEFLILGDGELADLTEIALKDLNKEDLIYKKISQRQRFDGANSVVLIVNPKFGYLKNNSRYLNLLSEISRNSTIFGAQE